MLKATYSTDARSLYPDMAARATTEQAIAKNSIPHKFSKVGRSPSSRRLGSRETTFRATATSESDSNTNEASKPSAGKDTPYRNADDPMPK